MGEFYLFFKDLMQNFFTPMWERDKKFSEALEYAKNIGVKIWCITLKIGFEEVKFFKQIPVKF